MNPFNPLSIVQSTFESADRMSPKNDFYPSRKALAYKGGSNDRQMNPPSTLLFHLFSSSDSLL